MGLTQSETFLNKFERGHTDIFKVEVSLSIDFSYSLFCSLMILEK
jgi:hypothetical protein